MGHPNVRRVSRAQLVGRHWHLSTTIFLFRQFLYPSACHSTRYRTGSTFSSYLLISPLQGHRLQLDQQPAPEPSTEDFIQDQDLLAIISQDPTLVASWRLLFAQAPRLPTNLEDTTTAGPKYHQDYLDVIVRSPNIPFSNSMINKRKEL
jgi:hypothetical protein